MLRAARARGGLGSHALLAGAQPAPRRRRRGPLPARPAGLRPGRGGGRDRRHRAQPPERERQPEHGRPRGLREERPAVAGDGLAERGGQDARPRGLAGAVQGPRVLPRRARLLHADPGLVSARAAHAAARLRARGRLVGGGPRAGPVHAELRGRRLCPRARPAAAPRRDPDAGARQRGEPRRRLPGRRRDAAPPARPALVRGGLRRLLGAPHAGAAAPQEPAGRGGGGVAGSGTSGAP